MVASRHTTCRPRHVSQRGGAALPARMGEGRAQDTHHFDRHGFDPSAWTRRPASVAFDYRGRHRDCRRTHEWNGLRPRHQLPHGRPLRLGPPLDREVGDLVPNVPIEEDLGRDFLYARYDPELTYDGFNDLGLASIDPVRAAKLDSTEAIDDLLLIGRRYAQKYLQTKTQIGPFLPASGTMQYNSVFATITDVETTPQHRSQIHAHWRGMAPPSGPGESLNNSHCSATATTARFLRTAAEFAQLPPTGPGRRPMLLSVTGK
jgi:hypothetical protein